jgi:quercetin dioxygenase-like cupin family protein
MKIFVVRHRTFLALAVCVAIGVGGMTLAQHTGKGEVKVIQLSQRDIIEKLDGKDARARWREVTFEPGQRDSPHRHAGPVFGYVLEGEYEHAINDEPVKTYKAGETFYEPSGAVHRVARNPKRQDQDPPPGGDPAPPRRQERYGPGEGQGIEIVGRNRAAALRTP